MGTVLCQERPEWPGRRVRVGRQGECRGSRGRERETERSEAAGSSGQASGRGSVSYLLFLLLVLHGRTEVLSPVCLPLGLDL